MPIGESHAKTNVLVIVVSITALSIVKRDRRSL